MNELTQQKIELVDELTQYLKRFHKGVLETVELLNKDEEQQQAKENIVQIIDGLDWSIKGMVCLQNHIQFDIEKINEVLLSINDSLESSDDSLLADLFEYEMIPIVVEWEKKLKEIRPDLS